MHKLNKNACLKNKKDFFLLQENFFYKLQFFSSVTLIQCLTLCHVFQILIAKEKVKEL